MAQERIHIVQDDDSPIRIGSGGDLLHSPFIKTLVRGGAHIFLQHRCFREIFGGLAVQNVDHITTAIETDTDSVPLPGGWSLALNGGALFGGVDVTSADRKSVHIAHFLEYDLAADCVCDQQGKPQPQAIAIFGMKALSSATVITIKGIFPLTLGKNGISIKWKPNKAKKSSRPRPKP